MLVNVDSANLIIFVEPIDDVVQYLSSGRHRFLTYPLQRIIHPSFVPFDVRLHLMSKTDL
jgi:hypothetical protein